MKAKICQWHLRQNNIQGRCLVGWRGEMIAFVQKSAENLLKFAFFVLNQYDNRKIYIIFAA